MALAKRAGAPPNADAAALRALPVSALVAANTQGVSVIVDGRMVKAAIPAAFAAGARPRSRC